jgi:chaperone modulatory protein CbpM
MTLMGHVHLVQAVLDADGLTLDELCRVVDVSPQWVAERVEAGLLAAAADERTAWRFDALALRRVHRMVCIERDFDAVPELAALVADLEAEIERLRARLARAGLG